MIRRIQLLAIVLLPLAIVGGLVLLARGTGLVGYGAGYVERVELPKEISAVELPQVTGDASLPLVVIDAGHGGHDPGASAQGYVE